MNSTAAIDGHILDEAAVWLMRLHAGDITEAQRRDWQQWCQRSPDHARAWQRAAQLGQTLSVIPPAIGKQVLQPRGSRRKTVKALSLLLAAGPAAWLGYRLLPLEEWRADYSSGIGQRRRIVLEDGTRLTLNTASAVDVIFDRQQRKIHLRAGEILIDTAKDPQATPRPFLVQSAQGTMQALGTRFLVRQLPQASTLAVFEGAVRVQPAAAHVAAQTLAAGWQMQFTAAGMDPPQVADESASAWDSGMLVADRMPLRALLADLGRYRHGQLGCDDHIAQLPVSGAFPIDNTDAALALLAQSLPVRLQYLTRYWVRVLPRE